MECERPHHLSIAMRYVLFLTLIFFVEHAAAQPHSSGVIRDTVQINGFRFEFRTDTVGEEGEGIVSTVVLSRIKNGAATKLLTHVLFASSADCNSIQLELGKWEVKDSLLIFYSYWARSGDAPAAPCAVRKQVYAVHANGKVSLISADMSFNEYGWVYVKDKNWFYDEEDPESIKAFKEFYGARFLSDKEGIALDKEVKLKLKKEIAKQTLSWEDPNVNGTSFGYCK